MLPPGNTASGGRRRGQRDSPRSLYKARKAYLREMRRETKHTEELRWILYDTLEAYAPFIQRFAGQTPKKTYTVHERSPGGSLTRTKLYPATPDPEPNPVFSYSLRSLDENYESGEDGELEEIVQDNPSNYGPPRESTPVCLLDLEIRGPAYEPRRPRSMYRLGDMGRIQAEYLTDEEDDQDGDDMESDEESDDGYLSCCMGLARFGFQAMASTVISLCCSQGRTRGPRRTRL
ncbi:hypothetical protein K402DRAFT_452255 [Aulographum hederae CBS 113979]|uniref:Uncharacterized protein n=1 Tax=Aulographum hederae CBS 113979 TaxID=1176131 RepID=A0A6G1H7D2_9PEZI|nr:hypothetical protein K402DRAFT_452255 [Aulographum hederae CBS 113979]